MLKVISLLLALLMPQVSISANISEGTNQTYEAMATRTYFYVGGHYVDDGPGMHLFMGQMYVEKLVPRGGAKQKEPIIFIHGAAQTGTAWLNTPDGRLGWASWFLKQQYVVYLVDQPERGRSAWLGDGSLASYSAEVISALFTAVQDFDLWPQSRLHTQWPGTGLMGDPVYDAFYASQVRYQSSDVITQTANQDAGAALLDLVGPAIVVTHSQGGPIGFLIADARPTLVKALISLEPQGPPFEDRVITNSTAITRPYGLTNIPITYQPPVINPNTDLPRVTIPPAGPNLSECVQQASPAKQLPNLAKLPHLVVQTEASYHAVYDYCTVRYLQQAGVSVDFLQLSTVGIHGNAHLLYLEKNNLQIAAKVGAWIKSKVTS